VLFVKAVGADLKPLLVHFETSKAPIAHEVYPKLESLKLKFNVFEKGVYSKEVTSALDKLSASAKKQMNQTLRNSGEVGTSHGKGSGETVLQRGVKTSWKEEPCNNGF